MEYFETPCTSFLDEDSQKINKEKKIKKVDENRLDTQNAETVSFRRYVLYPIENRNYMYNEESEDNKGEKEKNLNAIESDEIMLNGFLEGAAR